MNIIYSKQFDFSGVLSDIEQTTQDFLLAQQNTQLSELKGADSSYLTEIVDWIKQSGLSVTHQPLDKDGNSQGLPVSISSNDVLLRKIVAYFLPKDPSDNSGFYYDQIKSGIASLKALVTKIAANPETRNLKLSEFLMTFNAALDASRIDDDIIQVMRGTMRSHSVRRDKIRDEVRSLTAELKIYAVIQSEVNSRLSSNGYLNIAQTGTNLLDYRLYGYSNVDDFLKGDEYKLLLSKINSQAFSAADVKLADAKVAQAKEIQERLSKGVSSYPSTGGTLAEASASQARAFKADEEKRDELYREAGKVRLTIREFLESDKKESGALSGLENDYSYNKDNNKLGNFATTLSDRSRPLNDKLSQKTTELNDISSRYNSAIEALNRFIQKYESMMQQILQAI